MDCEKPLRLEFTRAAIASALDPQPSRYRALEMSSGCDRPGQ